VIWQRPLGTTEIGLIHHTDCGMLTFRDDDVKDEIAEEIGTRLHVALEAFADPACDARTRVQKVYPQSAC
jgi:carbonic anhydrase